ncbi:MAG: DUF559 domain-containing protein [Acidimicrobiia bacterium]
MAHVADLRIAALAAEQHGAFARWQALDVGASASLIERRVRAGRWARVGPEAFILPGSPATWERAVNVAVFSTGRRAAASHATAAYLHGLVNGRPERIEVVTPRCGVRGRVYVVHQSTDLKEVDLVRIRGIVLTTVGRTLADMGVPWGLSMTARGLDEALRRDLTTLQDLARLIHRLARRGRSGIGVIRVLVEERLGWDGITQSQLEDAFRRLMWMAGLPMPVGQVRFVKRGGSFIARTDFAYPELGIVIELDSERYHLDRRAFRHDRRRQNELVLEGKKVLRFTTWDVFAAPELVVEKVSALIAQSR